VSSAHRWVPQTVAVVAGLAVVLAGYVMARADAATGAGCVTLNVVSSTEKAALIGSLATAYNQERRKLPSGGCARVRVEGLNSGAAMEDLASGWTTSGAQGHPKPDVWLPTSSMWITQLQVRRAFQGTDLTADLQSVAHSPLVIAMPQDMAQAVGWPARPLAWQDVLGLDSGYWARTGHPEWGRFTYAKDDPLQSTSGFAATVATYYAAAGKTQGLSVADVNARPTQDFVRQVEANVVFHPSDSMDFLADLTKADTAHKAQSYVSAIVVQEQLAYLYNEGNPEGDPAKLGKTPRAGTQFVAIHPANGTLMMDHPYVVLPGAPAEAAIDFRTYLQQPAQKARFAALGFRDDRDVPAKALAESLRFGTDQRPSLLAQPPADVMEAIRTGWKALSKRANLLVVVDASGSMNSSSGIAGRGNRMDAAKAALRGNARLLNPDDQVALWSFASDPAHLHPELLAPTRFADGSGFAAATNALRVSAKPYDDTALCVTTRDAQQYLRSHAKPDSINAVVVLTDGINDYPADPCAMDALGPVLASADPAHEVKVFTIGFGADAKKGLPLLESVSAATGAQTIDATHPADLDNAFAAIFHAVSSGA
jgi:Ca-activated chloride channel family protein